MFPWLFNINLDGVIIKMRTRVMEAESLLIIDGKNCKVHVLC